MKVNQISKFLYPILALFCFFPFVSPPLALILGLGFALVFGVPFPKFNKKTSKYLLQVSVVGLGFGMHLQEAIKAGGDGIIFTVFSVISVMTLGIWLGKLLKVDQISSYLISSGTAICGGSAIAAVGPVAKANDGQMSVSLATIFVLNAVALIIFPIMGHWFNMSQTQFGMWSAIAIHDTSSVVGAASTFGEEALKIATTVKLTRALWIIPLSIFTAFYFKSGEKKISIPWFILFFILAMIVNSIFNLPELLTSSIVAVSKQALAVTLFFIGAGLSRSTLRSVGLKPLLLGIILWFFIAVISFAFIYLLY